MKDWDSMEEAYVRGDECYRALSERMQVSLSALKNQGKARAWVEKRRAFREAVLFGGTAQGLNQGEDKLGQLRTAADALAGVVEEAIRDGQQFHRHIVAGRGKDAGAEEFVFQKLDVKSLREAIGALKDLAAVLKELYPQREEGDGAGAGGVVVLAAVDEEEPEEGD